MYRGTGLIAAVLFLLYTGMRHTPHDTRHTFISGLDSAGVPRSTQKFIVGHSLTKDVTDRYTHKSIAELCEAVDGLEY